MMRPWICGALASSCLIALAGSASAATIRYELTGATSFMSERLEIVQRPDGTFEFVSTGELNEAGITNVPIMGEALLTFDGSRVQLDRLDVSFSGVDLFSLAHFDASLQVTGGAGTLMDGVLAFDMESLLAVDLVCRSTLPEICAIAAGSGELQAFILNDLVFDLDGSFTTRQDFGGGFPIGAGGSTGLGDPSGRLVPGVALTARQVPEPTALGLAATLALFLAASAWARRRAC